MAFPSFPSFSAFPPVPQRSAPEADFDAKMYALFQHFATTHRNEILAFIAYLEENSTVIDGALNDTTLGLTVPAAARVTTLEAERFSGGAVVGAVSQAAGVPTGALLEYEQNANGHYIRYADGTQICWYPSFASAASATTWTYPAAFSLWPTVTASVLSTGARAVTFSPISANSIGVRSWNMIPAASAETVNLMAVGRWY